jgi:ribose 5-phosphate isomerase B
MIALGCDHGGYELMQEVKKYLEDHQLEYKDFGTYTTESCDYPVYGKKVARAVASGECDKGILICGTGLGITMAASRVPGIRAAVCTNEYMARLTREHNDANILGMGARVIGAGTALSIVETFLNTPFSEGERHKKRIAMIEED